MHKVLLLTTSVFSHQAKKIREGFIRTNAVESVKILGFERPLPKSDCECEILGRLDYEEKGYFSRLPLLLKSMPKIMRECSKADIVFAWSLDMSIMATLARLFTKAKRSKFIYCVRDVRGSFLGDSLRAKIFRRVDRFIAKRADLVAVTSPAYISGYYKNILNMNIPRHYALENKVPPELVELGKGAERGEEFLQNGVCIGVFGIVCRPKLMKLVNKISDRGVKFYIRGHVIIGNEFFEELKEHPNVEYGGGYKNPDDMAEMFSKCDMSWAVNSQDFKPATNDEWAMCNRFYEALFFRKPLVVQKGSAHDAFVREHDVGVVIDARDEAQTAEIISKISPADILRWRENIAKIPAGVYEADPMDYKLMMDAALADNQ